MDLKELITFQTILKEGTFSRAAEKLNYAQSTISNQMQRLEKEIGIQLFNRGWDVELTSAGERFASEIDKLIQHWNDVANLTKALQQDEIGNLYIGGIESAMQTLLPSIMRLFHEQKPRISCQFTMGNTDTLAQAIIKKELDFAICGEPSDSSPFFFEPLYQEKVAIVVDRSHPLLERNQVPFRELLQYPIISGGPTCLYFSQITKRLSHYEVTLPNLHTINQISAIPHFAKGTLAVGLVLDSTPLIPELVRMDVVWDEPVIPIGILMLRRQHTPPFSHKQLFVQLLKKGITGS
ncbi:LysR family transcriptional regulator [Paenibacillus qinlingensis]|uniref:LysR family transcriptional regulator n=1 Tax=Paenibacillus qinlingensis TaxID=1837343 RepID=UPI0015666712|nr:LysR family transcriptional regulator [Paenibacillus qinlingensis]NQX62228.1 LysR family transcriptional regulator [Paenibacillus qinlingensis]